MPWILPLWKFMIFLIPLTSSDFVADLERIKLVYDCDPYCTFNKSEITSNTAKLFPESCSSVCGILTLNQNTDLTESEIKHLFKKMTTIYGALRFENTTFSNFNFFEKNPDIHGLDFYCATFGLTVINNTELTDISFLKDFFLAKDRLTDECILKFEKNPKLDAIFLCEHEDFKDFFELKVVGNLKDCGCRGDLITSENLETLKGCKKIEGGLHLFNLTDSSYLTQITHIKGDVEIHNTSFKDLSFFKNLKEIQTKHGLITEKVSVNVHDNPEMTRFGISRIDIIYDILEGPFIFNFENLHPDFCLTFQELWNLMDYGVSFKNMHAKFCNGSKFSKIEDVEVCKYTKLKTLKPECYFVHGNIVIDSENEKYVEKLKDMDTLFGTLTIKNTNLENLKFLNNLRYIVSLEDEFVIEISSNKKLVDTELPALSNIITKGPRTVVLNKNPVLESDDCMIFQISYQTNVAFVGDNCGTMTSTFNEYYFDELANPDDRKFLDVYYDLTSVVYYLNPFKLLICCIGFILNIFHLVIVTRKPFRSNSIYVIMTGITVSDLFTMLTMLYDFYRDRNAFFSDPDCWVPLSYLGAVIYFAKICIQNCLRRLSAWLALLMALVRLLIVKNPLNANFSFLSTRFFALVTIFTLFFTSCIIEFLTAIQYELVDYGPYRIRYCYHYPRSYKVPYNWFVSYSHWTDNFRTLARKYSQMSDGLSKIIPAAILPILSFLLIRIMKKAAKSRKSLAKNQKDTEFDKSIKMVALMTVFSMFAEGAIGMASAITTFYWDYIIFIQSKEKLDDILINLVVLNTIVHSIICYTVNSQYRDEVRKSFLCWCKNTNKIGGMENQMYPSSTKARITASNAVID